MRHLTAVESDLLRPRPRLVDAARRDSLDALRGHVAAATELLLAIGGSPGAHHAVAVATAYQLLGEFNAHWSDESCLERAEQCFRAAIMYWAETDNEFEHRQSCLQLVTDALMPLGKYGEAITVLTALINAAEEDEVGDLAACYGRRGRAYMYLQEYGPARSDLAAARRHSPDHLL